MQCKFIKQDGDQCEANSMRGGFCYLHNPEISEEVKREGQTKGGQARSMTLENPLPVMPANTPEDAILLIADTINRVRAGEMDIRTANCIGFLSDKLLKAFEVAKLNDKVEYIERILAERRG